MARPKRKPFTPRLRENRDRLGLTQEEVAEQVGITSEMVRRHEKGLSFPQADYRECYVRLFDKSETELGLYVGSVAPFFGIGPIQVGVPLRMGADDRPRTYVDEADLATQAEMVTLLGTLALNVEEFKIARTATQVPDGNAVIICGPKSAPLGTNLLADDPRLGIVRNGRRWWIEDRKTRQMFGSPMSAEPCGTADLGYLSRHVAEGRVIVHIAGIHSPGSRGVMHYLTHNLAELYRDIGDGSFSMVVRCGLNGIEITDSAVFLGPYRW